MLYLVALIVPGFAMMLAGKPGQGLFCILLQLTVIGWLPATIWAPMTVSDSKAEAFNKTAQNEWAYLRPFTTNGERANALEPFLAYYNYSRPHTALNGRPPATRL